MIQLKVKLFEKKRKELFFRKNKKTSPLTFKNDEK
jgi:hypothetical protein